MGSLEIDQGKVPLFDLRFEPKYRADLRAGMEEILNRAHLTNDRFVQQFESAFAATLGADVFGVAVSNGTAAIEVACRALRLEGKEILIPTNTFIASATAARAAGAVPVPFDIDAAHGIEIDELERTVTPATGALMVVHIGGIIQSNLREVVAWARARGLQIVEDCAHAHGSWIDGSSAGTFGDAGAYSFHLTKSMTAGEGGMVVTRDPDLRDRARRLRRFGESAENGLHFEEWSGNFKMTEVQGLMGTLELDRSIERLQRRRDIHQVYRSRLGDSPDLEVLSQSEGKCGYYKTIVRSSRGRAPFAAALAARAIPLTGGVYYFPLHTQPVMKRYVNGRLFPKADAFALEHFCPPCFPELSFEQVHAVCDVLTEASRGR